ncbi:tegument protein US11 [Human alphaherpesvirus 1]|nr:tegument protein US11 [Human alphaherpesvirus 1]
MSQTQPPAPVGGPDVCLKSVPSAGMHPRGVHAPRGHPRMISGPPQRGDNDQAAGQCGDSGLLRVGADTTISKPSEAVRPPTIPRTPRVPREPRVPRPPREPREPRVPRASRDPRVPRDPRDPRQPRSPREPRPPREPRTPRLPRTQTRTARGAV